MNKKTLSLLLVITMLLSLIPSSISTVTAESGIIATDVVAAADGNMTVTYAITSESDSEYTLTISGSGALADYSAKNTPWAEYNSKITKVIIPVIKPPRNVIPPLTNFPSSGLIYDTSLG